MHEVKNDSSLAINGLFSFQKVVLMNLSQGLWRTATPPPLLLHSFRYSLQQQLIEVDSQWLHTLGFLCWSVREVICRPRPKPSQEGQALALLATVSPVLSLLLLLILHVCSSCWSTTWPSRRAVVVLCSHWGWRWPQSWALTPERTLRPSAGNGCPPSTCSRAQLALTLQPLQR